MNRVDVPDEAREIAATGRDDPSLVNLLKGSKTEYVNGGTRVKAFLDEVERLRPGTKVLMNPRNARAIKDAAVKPELLAEAYLSARLRKWGDRWLWENMSVWAVVNRLDTYLAAREAEEDSAAHSAADRQFRGR